jgi:hypothetical protein
MDDPRQGMREISKTTYNGGDSEALLLSVLEEMEDVITDDDARLAGKLLEGTHCDSFGSRYGNYSAQLR